MGEDGGGSGKNASARAVQPVGEAKGLIPQACSALHAAKICMAVPGEFDSKLYQNRNGSVKTAKREHANPRKRYSGQDRAHGLCAAYAAEMQAVVRRWGW